MGGRSESPEQNQIECLEAIRVMACEYYDRDSHTRENFSHLLPDMTRNMIDQQGAFSIHTHLDRAELIGAEAHTVLHLMGARSGGASRSDDIGSG
jgi:hypothetical protein